MSKGKKRAQKPLPARVVNTLVRVTGNARVGYGVDVSGLLGTDEIQTHSRALALHLCRAVRRFVMKMPPAAQRRAFDEDELAAAEDSFRR